MTSRRAAPPDTSQLLGSEGRWWLPAACLLLAVLAAYQPAWQGGLLWDDEGHLTRPELRSPAGFLRIWSEPAATQQYYPVVHSAFWLQHALWGGDTLGYHLVSVVLHGVSAFLFGVIRFCCGSACRGRGWPRRSSRCIRCTSNPWPGSAS